MAALTTRKGRRARNRPDQGEINVVSLIDIFAILVFYLLVNALVVEVIPRYQDITLPRAEASRPPERKRVLAVGRDWILVDDQPLITRQALDREEAGSDAAIPALVAALSGTDASAEGAGVAQTWNIVADREIPYVLLKRILASCAEAGVARVLLAVESPGSQG